MTRGTTCHIAAVFALALALWPLSAEAVDRKVFLHLKTGITQDDNQMCVAFNIALAAVQAGDQVEMFFDAAAVFDLQNASAEGASSTSQPASQPTTSDKRAYNLRYELPDKLKEILSAQFGIPKAQLPQDYYEYLQMLRNKGVEVTFNGTMAHLVSLSDSVKGKEKLADVAAPLDLREVVEHRAQADIYLVY